MFGSKEERFKELVEFARTEFGSQIKSDDKRLYQQFRMLESSGEILVKRRWELHKYFLSIMTVLFAGLVSLISGTDSFSWGTSLVVVLGTIAGIVLSIIWLKLFNTLCKSIKVKLILLEALEETIWKFKSFKNQHKLKKKLTPNLKEGQFESLSGSEGLIPITSICCFVVLLGFSGFQIWQQCSLDRFELAEISVSRYLKSEVEETNRLFHVWETAQKKFEEKQKAFIGLKVNFQPLHRFGESDSAFAARIKDDSDDLSRAARELKDARIEMLQARAKFAIR